MSLNQERINAAADQIDYALGTCTDVETMAKWALDGSDEILFSEENKWKMAKALFERYIYQIPWEEQTLSMKKMYYDDICAMIKIITDK